MALVLADRVRETTTTAGTGTITLLGAVPSCQSFAVVGNGNTTYYTIVAQSGTEWEVGIGTYTSSGTTLSRDTVLSSSNSGSLVDFSAGTKDVFVDYPAGKAVYENAAGNVDGYPITGGTIDNTTIGATTPSTGVFTTLTATGQTSLGGVTDVESFRVSATSGTAGNNNYLWALGSASSPSLYTWGTSTNVPMLFRTRGSGQYEFATGSSSGNIQARITHTASAVNYVQVTGAITGGNPQLSVQGSDANPNFDIYAKGSGVVRMMPSVLLGRNSANYFRADGAAASSGPVFSVAGSDTNIDLNLTTKGSGKIVVFPSAGWVSGQVAQINLGDAGSNLKATAASGKTTLSGYDGVEISTRGASPVLQFNVAHTASAVNYMQATGQPAGFGPLFSSQGSDTNINMVYMSKGTGGHAFGTGGGSYTQQLVVSHTASAVNYVQVTGAATGSNVAITSQGSDANIGLDITAKGGGFVRTGGWLRVGVSSANYLQLASSSTGFGPVISSVGSDTDIPLVLQPKGTGALQAQQTDSTATGGNARGANAVDWQTSRNNAVQVASGQYAVIAGGNNNTASGINSFIGGGTGHSATTTYSTVCSGLSNTSSGLVAVIAGGQSNIASSYLSFIGSGISNIVGGRDLSAIVGGSTNTAAGFFNFVGGGFTNSGTAQNAVTTQSATMNGTTAVTLSGSNASIKVGQLITGTSIASYTYVAAISGTSLTLSQAASGSSTSTLSFYTPHGVVVGGGNNQATGSYSFIGGGGDAGTAANRNVASGDWSAVVGGYKNTASGIESAVVNGDNNTASGTRSFIGAGQANIASASGSAVFGGRDNNSNAAFGTIVSGVRGNTRGINTYCVFSSSAPISETSGGTQAGLLVIARQTTDATPTVLAADGAGAGTTNQVILPNNSAYYFKGSVIANVTGAANGAAWDFTGAIMRGANAASTVLIGTPSINRVAASAGATAWTIAITADTTNGGLAVTVTGAAATTIRWVAKMETTEVTY